MSTKIGPAPLMSCMGLILDKEVRLTVFGIVIFPIVGENFLLF